MRNPESIFAGTYDITLKLKTNEIKHLENVIIDNEQWKYGNLRVTLPNSESVLFMKSDIRRIEYRGSKGK